jgi:NADH-quinone oxidoreductase subunit L
LVARSYPIFQQAPIALRAVAFIGAIGTVYAAGMGLTNNDIKRVLAFSTMSQIAYMFVGLVWLSILPACSIWSSTPF